MPSNPVAQHSPRLRMRLTGPAERQVHAGHPWVYETGIREQNREGSTGELAVIYDRNNKFLAIGLYDTNSPIRVRVLHKGQPQTLDLNWWKQRLKLAVARRRGLFDDTTTGFRLINGESDGWPGLVLDKYDACLVLKLYTAAWFLRLNEVVSLITEAFNPRQIVLRLSRNIQEEAARHFELSDGLVLHGPPIEAPVLFRENGIAFEADVVRGQKTGFFLDQRENRKRVGELSVGRTVLNAFSFSGGFSLYAAIMGAVSVLDLDISNHALESSKRNHAMNTSSENINVCVHEWQQGDTFDWLSKCSRTFDVVVLDPPSLARREAERAGALRAYRRLAALGASRTNPNGIIACFSCSAHVSEKEFFEAALEGARTRGECKILQTAGHALDHPVTFSEAKYLKGIYLRKDKNRV